MKQFSSIFILFVLATGSLFGAASAQDMRDARERMIERLPEMENLWNRGLTGENRDGYVTARSSLKSSQIGMIQAENRDRLVLYTYIGEKTGTDHFQVASERAAMVMDMAKSGLWVQKDNGDWIRK